MPKKSGVSGSRRRTRRRSEGTSSVRVLPPEPRRTVKATRRAYVDLYAPRLVLNPWLTKRDWRASRPKFLAGMLILALAFGIYQLFSADVFYVNEVTVSGNQLLPPSEIQAAAGVDRYNIFFLTSGDVEQAVQNLPEIKSARVTLSLPNRVEVQVVERLPQIIWKSGKNDYWVDDNGTALRARSGWSDALVLRDVDGAPVKIGDRVNPEAFNAAVGLRNAWPDGPKVFEWSSKHGLSIKDEHGWPIYFGSASQMPEKVQALRIITKTIIDAKKNVSFIDLGSGLPYFQELVAKK